MPGDLKRNHSVVLNSDPSIRLWLILVQVLLPKLLPLLRSGSAEMGPFLSFIGGIQIQVGPVSPQPCGDMHGCREHM